MLPQKCNETTNIRQIFAVNFFRYTHPIFPPHFFPYDNRVKYYPSRFVVRASNYFTFHWSNKSGSKYSQKPLIIRRPVFLLQLFNCSHPNALSSPRVQLQGKIRNPFFISVVATLGPGGKQKIEAGYYFLPDVESCVSRPLYAVCSSWKMCLLVQATLRKQRDCLVLGRWK